MAECISHYGLEFYRWPLKQTDTTDLLERSFCKMCNENLIEDEVHFICTCKVFRQEHEMLHNKMITWCPDFRNYVLNGTWQSPMKLLKQ